MPSSEDEVRAGGADGGVDGGGVDGGGADGGGADGGAAAHVEGGSAEQGDSYRTVRDGARREGSESPLPGGGDEGEARRNVDRGRRVLPMGDAALLLEVADLDAVLALAAAVRAADWPGVTDVVPGARTVLLVVRPGTDLAWLRRAVLAVDADAIAAQAGPVVEIAVAYEGPDLAEVAELTGLSVDAVVAAHTGTPWRVGFGGFAPGFAYLTGGDPRLRVARRAEPRTSVPAGAVGLAGEFSGVYPRSSPGGWQLIGRTDAVLWDPTRTPPALLSAGAQVRFVAQHHPPLEPSQPPDPTQTLTARPPASTAPTPAHPGVASTPTRPAIGSAAARPSAVAPASTASAPARPPIPAPTSTASAPARPAVGSAAGRPQRALEVVRVGPLALLQDLGRPGHAAVGVPRSGAADRAALRLANRLVANDDEGAVGVEVLLGGLAVRSHGLRTVALTGAAARADVDGTPVGHHCVLTLRPGQTLTLGAPPTGLRTYLAVRGGFDGESVLGSSSTDTLSDLGPPPLSAGDLLRVGPEPRFPWLLDVAPVAPPTGGTVELRAVPGPRASWLEDLDTLVHEPWTVSSRSDRVGMRLSGEPLRRADRGELASEGMVRGAIQVPPDGQPVVFLADHPVTGGYPVVAVLLDADVDRAAQARPGQSVRLRLVAPPWKDSHGR